MEELHETTATKKNRRRSSISGCMSCAAVFASVGGFLFGFHTGGIANGIPLIKQKIDMDHLWQEVIVSCTIATAAIAAPIGGVLSEYFGRKFTIRSSGVFFLLGGTTFVLARDKLFLMIARMLSGFATGLACTSVPLYIAECSPANGRGFLVSLNSVFITGGSFVGNFLCAAFSGYNGDGWRIAFAFACLPPIIQLIAFHFLPESPLWYLDHGRYYDARDALKSLRNDLLEATNEYEQLKKNNESDDKKFAERGKSSFFSILVNPKFCGTFLIGWSLFVFQQICGINAIMYYSSTIMQMAGVKTLGISLWLAAAFSGIYFLCTILSLTVVERFGRRVITLASVLMVLISLLILASGFRLVSSSLPTVTVRELSPAVLMEPCSQIGTCEECVNKAYCGFCYVEDNAVAVVNGSCLPIAEDNNDFAKYGRCGANRIYGGKFKWNSEWCPSIHAWIPVVGLLLYLLCFAPGLGVMPWIVNAELYPRWYRTAGLSAATTINFIFNLITVLPFLTIIDHLGKAGTFYLFASFAFVALFLFFLFLPETGGKDLFANDISVWLLPERTTEKRSSNGSGKAESSNRLKYMRIQGHNRQFYDEDETSE